MKKTIVLLAVLLSTLVYSQKENGIKKNTVLSAISYQVDTTEELKTIDWNNIKEVFSRNTKNEEIEMSFAVNYKKGKRNFKNSIKVGGKSEDIDSLIVLAKKGVKAIIKIATKYEN
mgnify:CR=1 FL=1